MPKKNKTKTSKSTTKKGGKIVQSLIVTISLPLIFYFFFKIGRDNFGGPGGENTWAHQFSILPSHHIKLVFSSLFSPLFSIISVSSLTKRTFPICLVVMILGKKKIKKKIKMGRRKKIGEKMVERSVWFKREWRRENWRVQLFSSQTHQNSVSLNWEDYRRESKEQTLLLLDKNTLAPSNKRIDVLASLFLFLFLFFLFFF